MNQFSLLPQDIFKNIDIKSLSLLVVSVVIVFLLRSIWTIPIEVAGDAVRKFYAASEIIRTGDWTLLLQNHHTMRWSVVVPQAFLTWLVGTRYEIYYILPLLSFSLYFVIILYALKDHLNSSQKLLLGVLLFVDPMSFRNSSQLMTAGPGIFYAISACYVLATHSKKGTFAVIAAAVLFFCAYGSHVTYISFAAGAGLWLAFVQRSWKNSFIFAATLFGLLIIESIFFNYLSGWELAFGRIEALFFGPHVEGVEGKERYTVTFLQLFTRWLQLPVLDVTLCTIFAIAGLVFIRLKDKPAIPGFISCVYLVGLCFAVFNSFAVVGIDPITPVQRLLPRYLGPFLPYATIISVYFLSRITVYNRKALDRGMVVFATLLAIIISVFPQIFDHSNYPKIKIRTDAFIFKAERQYTEFARQIHEGSLIYKGRKKFVVLMITRFKYPVESPEEGSTKIRKNRPKQAKCVKRLVDIPSKLNYRKCKARKLE